MPGFLAKPLQRLLRMGGGIVAVDRDDLQTLGFVLTSELRERLTQKNNERTAIGNEGNKERRFICKLGQRMEAALRVRQSKIGGFKADCDGIGLGFGHGVLLVQSAKNMNNQYSLWIISDLSWVKGSARRAEMGRVFQCRSCFKNG